MANEPRASLASTLLNSPPRSVERKVWPPQTESTLGASGLQAHHSLAERTGREDAAGQTPALAFVRHSQRLPGCLRHPHVRGAALAGAGHLPTGSSELTDPTSRILDSPQPEETLPYQYILEETFPHTGRRAPLAMATSHRHICKRDPGCKQYFIIAQQLLRGPGSKWECTAPVLADSS